MSEIAANPHQPAIEFGLVRLVNPWWEADIRLAGDAGPYRIMDRHHGLLVADERYCYAVDVVTEPLRHACQGLVDVTYTQHAGVGRQSILPEGRLNFGIAGPTDIYLRHRITLPDEEPWLEEQLILLHRFGRHTHHLR